MCLMVWLGIDRKLSGLTDPRAGGVGLQPRPRAFPRALSGKRLVYLVSDGGCSCVFLDDDPSDTRLDPAYATLADIARAALKVDSAPLLSSCWIGEHDRRPAITRTVTPDEIRAGRFLFFDTRDGGTGGNPPILISLTDAWR